jgi:hypothetical protein
MRPAVPRKGKADGNQEKTRLLAFRCETVAERASIWRSPGLSDYIS